MKDWLNSIMIVGGFLIPLILLMYKYDDPRYAAFWILSWVLVLFVRKEIKNNRGVKQ